MKPRSSTPTAIVQAVVLGSWVHSMAMWAEVCPAPSFAAARWYATGRASVNAQSVALGDFNHDGSMDLAVASRQQDYSWGSYESLAVLLGNGDGSFQAAINYEAGEAPASVVAADLDRDGVLDLAVASTGGFSTNSAVSVFLGVGDGTFQRHVTYRAKAGLVCIVAADFNRDGITDVAVANEGSNTFNQRDGSLSVLLANGDGTLQAPIDTQVAGSRLSPEAGSRIMATGDFDGDGIPDVVLAQRDRLALVVLLGIGDGNFLEATYVDPLDVEPVSVTVADFNGDGALDLALANTGLFAWSEREVDSVSVLLGRGDGAFTESVVYRTAARRGGIGSVFVEAGDLNADGKVDLAVANGDAASVSALLGHGDGTFGSAANYNVGHGAYALAVSDLDRDGNADLVIGTAGIAVALGSGGGNFISSADYGVGTNPSSVAVGDFNADGKPDLAVANAGSGSIAVRLGKGDAAFQTALSYGVSGTPKSLATADFNGDGKLDLAAAWDQSAARSFDGGVAVLLSGGAGIFLPEVSYATGWGARTVAVGDLNGDGKPDLVVANQGYWRTHGYINGSISVLLGKGDGSFLATAPHRAEELLPSSVVVGDFNGDDKPDLAVGSHGSADVSVLLGNGDGTFQPARNYAAAGEASGTCVRAGDFNGDGKLDLAVSLPYGWGSVSILLGEGDGAFKTAVTLDEVNRLQSMTVGDLNGDGKLDLAGADFSRVSVLFGGGDGSFPTVYHYSSAVGVIGGDVLSGGGDTKLAMGDLNGDGRPDLATAIADRDSVEVLLNRCVAPRLDLRILRNGNTVILSWPVMATDFMLESTASLAPLTWQPVAQAPTNRNGRWEVNTPANGARQYFHLRRP